MPSLRQSMSKGASNLGSATVGNKSGMTSTSKTRNGASARHHHSRHPAQVFYAQACTAKKVKQVRKPTYLSFLIAWQLAMHTIRNQSPYLFAP